MIDYDEALANSPFTDVSKDAYYFDAVLWAVEQGITVGTSDTAFSPDADCTRAQMVTFLYRYFVDRGFDMFITTETGQQFAVPFLLGAHS